MSDVFVSYKAEDRRRVKPLVEALQAEGFSVWWDEQIGGGAAWRQAIEAELNAAKCVIVIWSNRSVGPEGAFVQDEATRAQQRHVYVPVLIDKVHLPLGFGETQALPLTGWHGDRSDARYQAALAAVRRNVGGKRKASTPPLPQARLDRRTAIAAGAVVAITGAGIGAWTFLKSGPAYASGSIAVLPFENLSGDPGQAYLSDGIAEELRDALSRISQLRVVGRVSSEVVRNEDAETAAKKLGVANIVTGSVRRSPTTVRVSAQLISGSDGVEKWSETYDRPIEDVLKVETEIATNVAQALSVKLKVAERGSQAVGGTDNAKANDLFLQAVQTLRSDNSNRGFQQAITLANAAIAADPGFAKAYALKAVCIGRSANTYGTNSADVQRGNEEALAAAKRAIELAPNQAYGYGALGTVQWGYIDLQGAVKNLARAQQLQGVDPSLRLAYAQLLGRLGRFADAWMIAQRAAAADPLNPEATEAQAEILYYARRYPEAVEYARRTLAAAPRRVWSQKILADTLLMMGQLNEAEQEYARLGIDDLHSVVGRSVISFRRGDRRQSDALLNELQSRYGDAANYQYGEIHAQRGEIDAAVAALRRGAQMKDSGTAVVKVDPYLDPLRSNPKFTSFVASLHLPS